jgi:hypothetical protein
MSAILTQYVADAPGEEFYVVTTRTDPAAGAEVSIIVPGRAAFELVAIRLELVTDATVAARRTTLSFDDGTVEFFRWTAGDTQAASLTRQLYGAAGLGYEAGAFRTDELVFGLPHLYLAPGFRVSTVTENLQAGDNYAAPRIYVRETPRRGDLAALAFAVDRLADRLERYAPLVQP